MRMTIRLFERLLLQCQYGARADAENVNFPPTLKCIERLKTAVEPAIAVLQRSGFQTSQPPIWAIVA